MTDWNFNINQIFNTGKRDMSDPKALVFMQDYLSEMRKPTELVWRAVLRTTLKLFLNCTPLSLATPINVLSVKHLARRMSSRYASSFPLTSSGSFTSSVPLKVLTYDTQGVTTKSKWDQGFKCYLIHTLSGSLSSFPSLHPFIVNVKSQNQGNNTQKEYGKKKESWILNWPYSDPHNLSLTYFNTVQVLQVSKGAKKRILLLFGSYIKLRI